ncbi:MAG: hypothetical protein K2K21_06410 [Lachnospiraceae bacterium]|nr:hypothetical protein [Lachnospiraceae bacterium]
MCTVIQFYVVIAISCLKQSVTAVSLMFFRCCLIACRQLTEEEIFKVWAGEIRKV